MLRFSVPSNRRRTHIWVVVRDEQQNDSWLAVDSYFGVVEDDYYYRADFSLSEFKYLDTVNPRWKI